MKNSFFHWIIPFFLLFLILFSINPPNLSVEPVQSQNSSFFERNLSSEDIGLLKNQLLNSSLNIADTLITNAQLANSSGLKWNKYYNLSDKYESEYYPGYYYGATGIGNYFTNLYNKTLNSTFLAYAEGAYSYINSQAIREGPLYDSIFSSPGQVFWKKAENNINVYIGIKYGNAGISKFLLNLYQNTHNESYLKLAEESLDTLIYKEVNAPNSYIDGNGIYWGYSPFKDINLEMPIADIIYGNAGIASSFLEAYKVTNNITYLKAVDEAITWIISQSAITDNTTNGQRYIRYSPDPAYPYTFTGYLTGVSGIGDLLLDYNTLIKNPDYLLFAQQIGNWLITKNENGLWPFGGADLLTDGSNNEGSFTGFGAGSAGIGLFLLHLYESTKDLKYLNPIVDISSMFQENAMINNNSLILPTKIDSSETPIYQSDLKMGLAGIGLFYSLLYNYFGLNEELMFLLGISNYLLKIKDANGIIPTIINATTGLEANYDLSVLEGLTGIGVFFLNAFTSLNSSIMFDSAIYANIHKTKNSLPNFESTELIIACLILAIIKRKKNLFIFKFKI